MQNLVLQEDLLDTVWQAVTGIVSEITPGTSHTGFITDMAYIMIMGAIVTLAFARMRQPIIIGYLFAGMLLGPISPLWTWILSGDMSPWSFVDNILVDDITTMQLFAELGVILLLFVIGIEFPVAKIRRVGKVAIGVGSLGLFATMGLVYFVAGLLGLGFMDSLFLAAALSISSTAVIVKVLEDAGRLQRPSSITVLAILIVEDIIAVILISTLQPLALANTVSIESVIVVLVVGIGLIGATITVGIKTIPPLIDKIASTGRHEIILLSILGLCFGYSLLANMVGLSVAIGAFLAGVLVAESKSAKVSKTMSTPIKDMFVAIFFISTGALMDISQIQDFIWISLAFVGLIIFAKFGANLFFSTLFRQKKTLSVRTATVLASPRGEFSLIIVKTGVEAGAVSAFLFPMVGLISIITTFIAPFLTNIGDKLVDKEDDQIP